MPGVESNSSLWSREQDKQFEKAIAAYPEESSDRWEKIAGDVAGKSVEEIKHHYEVLVDDVSRIESGFVELPGYKDGSASLAGDGKKGCNSGHSNGDGGKSSRSDQERRKGVAWTEDEHRLFLLGLDKYGKGDWRSISRNFVVTRTPTQVASHAQKYFIRLNSFNKDRRRSSIHDITTATATATAAAAPDNSTKPPLLPAAPTIGHPVGTPLNLPPPPPHVVYGVGTPFPVVPMHMPPITYQMPHASVHR